MHLKKPHMMEGYAREVANTLKFRYLGLGFLWAWIYATWFTPVVFPASSGLTMHSSGSWFASSIAVAVTLFVMPLLLRDRDLSSIPGSMTLAGPLTSLGALLMASEPLLGVSVPGLPLVGGILTGITSGWLWMLWGEFSGKVDVELAELFVPWCVAVPIVVMATCMIITGPAAGVAICLLPTISGFLLVLSMNDETAVKPTPLLPKGERPHYAGDFVRIGLGSLALYMCIGFVWGMLDLRGSGIWGDVHLVMYVAGAGAAIVIAVLTISYSSRHDLFTLYRWLVPAVLFGLLFLTIGSVVMQCASLVLITCAQYVFDIVIWVYFSRVAHKGVCSGGVAIGINRGFVQAGVVLGNFLVIGTIWLVERGYLTLTTIAFLLSAVATTVVLAVVGHTDKFERIMALEPQTSSGSETPAVDYGAICDKLGEEHALTAREKEVLGYLARGRSLPYIRDALVLSKNTVNTHVKNLYKKLDVHSRQELLDLFERKE